MRSLFNTSVTRPFARKLLAGATAAVAAAVAAAFAGCFAELPDPSNCRGIPSGGCPESGRNDVCAADQTCETVYRCQNTAWVKVATCSQFGNDAGADVVADASAADAQLLDAQLSNDARRDGGREVPTGGYGGPGCTPLQAPDCQAATAILCPAGCCGCEDLFVCSAGNWTTWGLCSNGTVTEVQARVSK